MISQISNEKLGKQMCLTYFIFHFIVSLRKFPNLATSSWPLRMSPRVAGWTALLYTQRILHQTDNVGLHATIYLIRLHVANAYMYLASSYTSTLLHTCVQWTCIYVYWKPRYWLHTLYTLHWLRTERLAVWKWSMVKRKWSRSNRPIGKQIQNRSVCRGWRQGTE